MSSDYTNQRFITLKSGFSSAALVLKGASVTYIIVRGVIIAVPLLTSAYLLHDIHGADNVIINELTIVLEEARTFYLSVANEAFSLGNQVSQMEWMRTRIDNGWDGDPEFNDLEARYRRTYERAETLFRSLRNLEVRMMRRNANYVPTANTLGFTEPENFLNLLRSLNR